MNDGFISIIIFWGQSFMVKHWRTPLPMRLHPCFIDCPANRWGTAFLNSLEAMRDCSLPLDLRHYPKVTCALFLNSGLRISGSTKSICFLCKLIGSSVNQPSQPCCVDLNGRSINCESRFDTSIPARSIFWTWWLDQCIPEQVQHRNRNVLIFLEILVWTQ